MAVTSYIQHPRHKPKTTDKLDFIKIKYFWSAKSYVNGIRRQTTDWEKIFEKDTTDKGLLLKLYKELLKLNNKTMNNWVKNSKKDQNRHLDKEDMQVLSKHMKRCSTSHIIRKPQNKMTMSYHYAQIKMAKVQNTDDTKSWWGTGVTGILIHCWCECEIVQLPWKTLRHFLTKLNIHLTYDLVITLLGIYQNEQKTYIHTKTCM